ncbi:vegetative cell wall protein gp1-like [Oryza sativa Japonica Group]|uniref:vegetative cell wall protein gp1-like n=1 Tax=Oryza sativa subsp. japonica TaxID=39947 RepID=UPI0007754AF6|nr:WAS/WASL-interacting protein family member 3-like [Oryza sativa Japonica Group]
MAGGCRPRPAKSGALPLAPSRPNRVKSVPHHLLHLFPHFSPIFGAVSCPIFPRCLPTLPAVPASPGHDLHPRAQYKAPSCSPIPFPPPPRASPCPKPHPPRSPRAAAPRRTPATLRHRSRSPRTAPSPSPTPQPPCAPRPPLHFPSPPSKRRSHAHHLSPPPPPAPAAASRRFSHRRAVPSPPSASPRRAPPRPTPLFPNLAPKFHLHCPPEPPQLYRLQPPPLAALAVAAQRCRAPPHPSCRSTPSRTPREPLFQSQGLVGPRPWLRCGRASSERRSRRLPRQPPPSFPPPVASLWLSRRRSPRV